MMTDALIMYSWFYGLASLSSKCQLTLKNRMYSDITNFSCILTSYYLSRKNFVECFLMYPGYLLKISVGWISREPVILYCIFDYLITTTTMSDALVQRRLVTMTQKSISLTMWVSSACCRSRCPDRNRELPTCTKPSRELPTYFSVTSHCLNHRHRIDKYLDTLLANQPISDGEATDRCKSLRRKMADCPS